MKFSKNAVLSLIFMVAVNLLIAQAYQFKEHVVNSSIPFTAGIATGLIDNDNLPDIVGGSNVTLRWYKQNEGESQWTEYEIDNTVRSVFSCVLGDFNNDGKNDIAIASWGLHQIIVYYQTGEGTVSWIKQIVASGFSNAHEVFCKDIDGDGDLDLAGAAAAGNEIAVWYNNGGNPCNWQKQSLSMNEPGARSVYITDLNNDGVTELVSATMDMNKVSVWFQVDYEPYWQEVVIDNQLVGAHRVRSVDIDNDGLLDLIAQGYAGNIVAWYRQNSGNNYSFTRHDIDTMCNHSLDVMFADFNLDGVNEIVSTSQNTNTLASYVRNGTYPFNWQKNVISNTFIDPWRVEPNDMDNDGDVDFVAGSFNGNKISFWENTFISCDFTLNHNSGHAPLSVSFNNISQDLISFTQFAWDFNGDDIVDSYEENPVYTYTTPGIYTVKLSVTNENHTLSRCYENMVSVFNGNSAILFNGNNTTASTSSEDTFNLAGPLTIECWIKLNGWGQDSFNGYGMIIDKRKLNLKVKKENGNQNGNCLVLTYSSTQGPVTLMSENNSLSLNQWTHIAVSFNGADETKMYIDGMEVPVNVESIPNANISDNSAYSMNIGDSFNGNFSFDGVIYELRIWQSVRSGDEIFYHMNHLINPSNPNLIAYYRFNEGNGNTLTDLKGNHDVMIENHQWVSGNTDTLLSGDEQNHKPEMKNICAYPNPFNPSTCIKFSLQSSARVKLNIYNVKGQKVKSLIDSYIYQGEHRLYWDGKDDALHYVSSGIYFIRLETPDTIENHKIILIK